YSLAATDAAKTTAESATIQSGDLELKLHDLVVLKLGQLPSRWPTEIVPRDLQYQITAKGQDGLKLEVEGALIDSWIDIFGGEVKLALKIEKAGGLARSASDGIAFGDDLQLRFDMEGPVLAPRVKADLRQLELLIPIGEDNSLPLRIEHAVPSWDLATESGLIKDVVAVTEDGGEVHLAASFSLDPIHFEVDVNIPDDKAIDLGPYFPESFSDMDLTDGSLFSGSLKVKGSKEKQKLTQLDLHLGNAHISGTAFRIDNKKESRIEATGINVAVRGTRIGRIYGFADPKSRKLKVDFDILSNDTAYWLRKFGTKPMLRSVKGHVRVGGSFDSPTVSSKLVAHGVAIVDRLDISLDYFDEKLVIREAQASAMGGWLRGSGKLLLGKVPRFRDVEAQVVNLNLSKIPFIGPLLSGELDLQAEGQGTAARPEFSVAASLNDWTFADEIYADARILLEGTKNGDQTLRTTIGRRLGGTLQIDVLMTRAAELAGVIKLDNLPIDSVFKALDFGTDIGGELSTEVTLGGTASAPTLDGSVTLLRSWFESAFLGTAGFRIRPVDDSKVRIQGSLFQNRIAIDCLLSTKAPYAIELDLNLHRIELDHFAAELSESVGMRGWISGQVSFRGNLLDTRHAQMTATLTETEIIFDHTDQGGRPSPIRLHNLSPLQLAFDGTTLRIIEPTTMTGPTGDFTLSGSGTEKKLDFKIEGSIAVQLLQPYLNRDFETMSGAIVVNGTLAGSVDDIQMSGSVRAQNIVLKPNGQDTIINIPTGLVRIESTKLTITELRVMVNDQFTSDVSELRIVGGIRLDNFRPVDWGVVIEGRLAAKLLLIAAPEDVSAASGSAAISMSLFGSGPDIDGSIEFDARAPFALTPRLARREFSFHSGLILFTDQDLYLENLQSTIDGEGQITDITGEISMVDWVPVDVDVEVSAYNLLYRIPQTLELNVNLDRFHIVGGAVDGLEISGDIEIADGRFIQRWDPIIDSFRKIPPTATEPSIFETVPILGNADIDINLFTQAFFIENNVADIEFKGGVNIKGTPLVPVFDGDIQVAQGTFKFQGMRAKFERTSGSVRFSPGLIFPAETPYLDIVSESEFRSSDGQQHLITLHLVGPYSELNWDLSTSTGLNRTQTLQLIYLGRTPDEVRKKLLGDDAISTRPGDLSSQTVESDSPLQDFDEVAKEYSSTLFASIIGDRLRDVTKLDVARLQLGTGSVGFYGEKNVTRSFLLTGEIERSLTGWEWNATGRYRVNDIANVEFGAVQQSFDDEADEDISKGSASITFREFIIP
ncbi:MAG: translocation/assembly module TamB domain-containing protein, partial [Kofleriaceae bacterium]|nr:translocation/assembly module TamB domain-containing protein [Kofleriaceae bacterium]